MTIDALSRLFPHLHQLFRQLRGKLDAVTLRGMADDDTWLDSFPITRLDLWVPWSSATCGIGTLALCGEQL